MEQDEYDEDREQEFEVPERPNDAFSEWSGTIEDAVDPAEDGLLGEILDDGTSLDDAAEAAIDGPHLADLPTANPVDDAMPGADAAVTQAFDGAADERDRFNHPSRYSPVTGERAPPNHFYLPLKPPAAPALGPPPDNALAAIEAAAGGASAMLPADPPRFSHEVARPEQGSDRVQHDIGTAAPAPREDIGQPLPRVLVTVSLAAARNLFDDALEDATRQMAERFRKLALNEIERAAFLRRAAERAADYSLRGPVF